MGTSGIVETRLGEVTANPHKDSDALMLPWGADWPSAITVTPPLFDSRINLAGITPANVDWLTLNPIQPDGSLRVSDLNQLNAATQTPDGW